MYKSGVKNKHHTGTGNSSLSKLLFSIEVDRVLFFFFFFEVFQCGPLQSAMLSFSWLACIAVQWTCPEQRSDSLWVCALHGSEWLRSADNTLPDEEGKRKSKQPRHMTWYIAFGSLWCCGSALGSAQAKNWSACEWIAPVKPRRENSYLCKHHFVALEGTGKAFYFFQKTAPKCAMCLRVFFLVVFSWLC